ncbi:hypothetical protein GCM10011332_15300 [Terasakiella brassicae]|uniref:RNA polymerase subunit sigma-54 n=1 Tax=Terasakiella brassicae TaxID=1634917 RepID=A0A917BYU7_9PROT|nr:HPF/RaiA family ribosome-associated protein [Terasakiella brassicae]GGF62392.1 hypothetical protein GCM10011332_15300 [Terasakiella brassicae]
MQSPLQIVFRDVDHSDAVEARIREKVEMLEKHSDKIVSCRVTVSAPHKSQTKGKLYDIRLDISMPGEEIVVNKNHKDDHAHEDVYVTIRDAFDAARRQIKEWVQRNRGEVKQHEDEEAVAG